MNINDFNIHYIDNRKHNDLYEKVIKESLQDVTINEGEVKIYTVFMEENDEKVKASLILLNAAPSKINFENIDIIFKNEQSGDAVNESCDFTFVGILPSNTITPFELEFNKDDFSNIKCDVSELKAVFNTKMTAHGSVIISNLDVAEDVRFEDKVQAKMYLKGLKPLKKDSITINAFDKYFSGNTIIVPIIVMNSYDKNATIKGFSVVLKDALDNVSGVKKVDSPISVAAKSASLVNVIFESTDLKDAINTYQFCTVAIS